MEILVATYNRHKIEELEPMFPTHRLLAPSDVGLGALDIEETGADYFDNAMIKAKALHERSGLPTLADDSGLSVTSLGGAPGIHSARYGSLDGLANLSSPERNALLLESMQGIEDRRCAFYCCLVFLYGEDRFLSVQETCPGRLALSPSGAGGFGYDPIVYLPEFGRTVAELSADEKNRVSHRGKAARLMNAMLHAAGNSASRA